MTVRKRGSVWYYDFHVRGTRYREAIPEARTKGEAREAETKAKREAFDGVWQSKRTPKAEPKTLKAFVEEYEEIAKETTRYYSCNVGYECRIICEKFGKRPLADISEFEVSKWLIELRNRYTGTTINHFRKRLKVIFNRATAAGYVEASKNPMANIGKAEETPRAKRRLAPDEEARLIKAARDLGFDYVASAIICRIETGLRPMEFARMERGQVRLSEGFIIARSYKSKSPQPKERPIPLTARARAEFERLASQAKGERIFTYDSIKKAWETVCVAAKIEEFWYRWLRDEAASRWADAGLDPFTIAQLLGHSSPKTSMIYVKAWASETARKMQSVTNASQEENGKVIRLPVSH